MSRKGDARYATANTGERSKSVNRGNPTDSSSLSITKRHTDILLMLIYSLLGLSHVFQIHKESSRLSTYTCFVSLKSGKGRRQSSHLKTAKLLIRDCLLLCNHLFYCLVNCTAHICCFVCRKSQGNPRRQPKTWFTVHKYS